MSLPTRERELKLENSLLSKMCQNVAPYTGA